MNRKDKGYAGEAIALCAYEARGYTLIKRNYTVPGGEIDLIVQDSQKIIFVEVKVVNAIDDIYDFLSQKKLQTLRKTIDIYLWKHSPHKDIQCDVVFVRAGKIFQVYEAIEV